MENKLFTEEKISIAYIRLAMPLVMSMVVSLVYNLADTFFVAQTNNTALVAGVSLGAPIFTLLMAFGNIFGQGGSSLISRLLGQQNPDGVRRASSFCFYVTLMVGVVVGIIMLVFRTPILYLIGGGRGDLFLRQRILYLAGHRLAGRHGLLYPLQPAAVGGSVKGIHDRNHRRRCGQHHP